MLVSEEGVGPSKKTSRTFFDLFFFKVVVLFSGYGALLLFLRTPTEAVGVDGTSSRVLERRLFSDRPLFRSAAGSPFADRPPLCTGFYRVFLLLVSPLGSSFCRSAPVRVFEELTGFYRVFFGGEGGYGFPVLL